MKVLVLAGDGMLGHKMFLELSKEFDTFCTIRGDKHYSPLKKFDVSLDRVIDSTNLSDFDSLRYLLDGYRPDVVVNCAGILKQRKNATNDYIQNLTINALLPHQIADNLDKFGGKLITFSSDCVFNGGSEHNYNETSKPDADSLYGKTKHLGEVANKENTLTIRTSMIGREIKGFYSLLEWFLRQTDPVGGYIHAYYSGVTTNYLARYTSTLINEFPDLNGLYNLTSDHYISKYMLLLKLRRAYGLPMSINPDTSFMPDKICFRNMECAKLQHDIRFTPPNWDYLLDDLVNDLTPYERVS